MSKRKRPPTTPQPPPQERLVTTYKGVQIYLFDSNAGHRREGWDHQNDRYLLAQWDPDERKDRGLAGSKLEDLMHETKRDINSRRQIITLN